MTRRKFGSYLGLCFVLALAAQAQQDDFHDAVARAARLSTLAEPGARPFHLKLTAQDTTMRNPEYNAEIEVWWAASDKWRRSVKSLAFTQIAIQNRGRYYESNSAAAYLPYWLDELIRGSVDPIPVEALANVSADADRPACGNCEVVHGSGDEMFSSYASMCFNPDGTAREIFAEPIGLKLAAYQEFGNKRVARQLNVWPGDRSEVTARVTVLEPLENGEYSGSGTPISNLFDAPDDTGLASRVRFVSIPESALAPSDSPRVRRSAGLRAIHFPLTASSRSEFRSTESAISANSRRPFPRIRPSIPSPWRKSKTGNSSPTLWTAHLWKS